MASWNRVKAAVSLQALPEVVTNPGSQQRLRPAGQAYHDQDQSAPSSGPAAVPVSGRRAVDCVKQRFTMSASSAE